MRITKTVRSDQTGASRRPRRRGGMPAFTLVELLVAMVIIVLLMAMLLPVIGKVRTSSKVAQTSSLISSLSKGCDSYAQDNNNLYPGQNRTLLTQGRMSLSPTGVTRMTGTQVMVAALTGKSVDSSGLWSDVPGTAKYFDIPAENLDLPVGPDGVDDSLPLAGDTIDQTLTGARHSVLDAFSNPLPILYYVSRPGRSGSGDDGVFVFEDNERGGLSGYPESSRESDFYTMLTKDPGATGSDRDDVMFRQESFVLIAAGADREFFNLSGGEYDDITNYNR